MKRKYKRFYFVLLLLSSFLLGCFFLFFNLKDSLVYFYSPTEIIEKELKDRRLSRLGGMVKKGSVKRTIKLVDQKKIEEIEFIVTDFNHSIKVNYIGILPDLFKEEQGVVVEGFLQNKKVFNARKVLAKHDENYIPPEMDFLKNKKGDL